ncbi:hypothetical protein ACJ2CR_04315 [Myxococcus faecalis]|uniref:hypothetical protein n=1 Tax=Myxococcus faecalis TaxID=3115646 RepID=UPI0038D01A4F
MPPAVASERTVTGVAAKPGGLPLALKVVTKGVPGTESDPMGVAVTFRAPSSGKATLRGTSTWKGTAPAKSRSTRRLEVATKEPWESEVPSRVTRTWETCCSMSKPISTLWAPGRRGARG